MIQAVKILVCKLGREQFSSLGIFYDSFKIHFNPLAPELLLFFF